MAETHEYRTAYADFLQSKEWDYFATVTCRKPRTDTLAFIRDYTSIAETALTGQMRGFVAVEPHQTGMLHIHGLLAYEEYQSFEGRVLHPDADVLQSKFDVVFGRSRVSNINSKKDVAAYCSKYVMKTGRHSGRAFEYDFVGTW